MQVAGDSVQITAVGNHLNDMYAYDLTFRYDPKKLSFQKFTSPIKGFSVEPIVKEDTVRIAHTQVGAGNGLSGKVEMATLVFKQVAAASSTIKLIDVQLVDSKLNVAEMKPQVQVVVTGGLALKDIAGHWAEAGIRQAVGLGFVTGYPDGTFGPKRQVTRAEFAVMLVKAMKLSTVDQKTAFKDAIAPWAEPYVATAVEEGLIAGYPDGTFRPGAAITREEMAVIIARALKLETNGQSKPGFVDDQKIAPWALSSVAAVQDKKIMNGIGKNQFAPKAYTTRAEAVIVLLSVA
ncbi:S-layer homology domain-containing protein [Cohnella sp. 56]|uniref:S-layer homology domain-containing protein n=1 Tax=Cohnella sp. 56 TaxID=3113722 RepID=UPI0030EA073B